MIAKLPIVFHQSISELFPLPDDIIDLHHDSASRNHHYVQLHRSNLIIRNSFFPGHAKEIFHSGIAAKGHGGGNLDQM
ncbi:MAG: hypothetical protein QNI97_12045 [Desulfobacterales bacterium]|nr:hypothetical protein [Desulfobacterales bacterium]MDJ0803595.1 hypothetical protein [Desulfobacterales bacterium]